MPARDYEVILYGAGGFTGKQSVAYFSQHAPAGLRWAIAGRHREKLEAARSLGPGGAQGPDILIADSADQRSVDAVVSRTRIVLNTAGPFALYGTPVVDACVRFGTHYVDITGETAWVHELITDYHQPAAAAGVRIIPCCGFDSVPSDLGTLLMARHIQRAFGVPCVEVRGYFQLAGGVNGGTIASLLNMLESGARAGGPFLLDPAIAHGPRQTERSRALMTPRHDPELGAWIGPFFMAPTNTRIVRRSAALYAEWQEPYGPEFVYQEALKYDPPFARAKAWATTSAIVLFFGAVRQPVTRRLVEPLLPKPGAGPSVQKMDNGWFTCDLLAIAENGAQARGVIRYGGDPGNRATTTFVCEAAMTLAVEGDRLPGGARQGGVLTPATGLGPVLADRLRRAGVTIDINQPA
ncbi:MAG TPA: saccharopine dehydrogenase NADP-binding domain-containing protein [Vicinamibacterales bacterium]|nr:saccharopine dehydrogenase NADP-binding domain-containing protein [Vicinamibacterales bacterium]